MILTPVCPHSLSFRPLILPSTSTVALRIPPEAHHTPVVSFDGRGMVMLRRRQVLIVTRSPSPILTLCRDTPVSDWIASLEQCLFFNMRKSGTESMAPPPPLPLPGRDYESLTHTQSTPTHESHIEPESPPQPSFHIPDATPQPSDFVPRAIIFNKHSSH